MLLGGVGQDSGVCWELCWELLGAPRCCWQVFPAPPSRGQPPPLWERLRGCLGEPPGEAFWAQN